MKKVAIYARVSTGKQKEEKTIESQVEKLREIATDNNLVKEYLDDGYSGETLDRPKFDEMMEDARNGVFEVLYLLDPDRLSRDLGNQLAAIKELEKYEIELKFVNREYKNTPDDKLLFQVQGVMAEYEKSKILLRTRRGRIHKANKGIVVGTEAPYGYTYIKKIEKRDGYYKVNQEEAIVVKLIFELYLQNKSVLGVIRGLHDRNIKPRRNSEYWEKSTLGRLLRNETYIGTTYYNKQRSIEINNGKKYKKIIKSGRVARKKEEWIPIKVTPIINKGTFYQVQNILEFNKNNKRGSKRQYLLTGLLKCNHCSSSYAGDSTRKWRYYRCSSRLKLNTIKEKCPNKTFNAEKLENKVWDTLKELLDNPELIIKQIKNFTDKFKNEGDNIKQNINEINQVIQRKKEGKQRIIKALANGSITDKEFDLTIEQLNEEIQSLDREKKELVSKIEVIKNEPDKIKNVTDFCNTFSSKLNSLSFEEKKEVTRLLCEKIELGEDKTAEIHTIIPRIQSNNFGTASMLSVLSACLTLLSKNPGTGSEHPFETLTTSFPNIG